MKPFAIIANPRTGSTALANFFRDMDMPLFYEPFRPDKWIERELDLTNELQRAFFENKRIGMKHVTSHSTTEQNQWIVHWLGTKKIVRIFLRRKDLVMSTLSIFIAYQTGIWEIQHGDTIYSEDYDGIELEPISIDEMHSKIQTQRNRDSILNVYIDYLMFYETYFNRDMLSMKANIDRLFLEVLKVSTLEWNTWRDYAYQMAAVHFSPNRKQNRPHIYERIPNWQEIKQEFNIENDS